MLSTSACMEPLMQGLLYTAAIDLLMTPGFRTVACAVPPPLEKETVVSIRPNSADLTFGWGGGASGGGTGSGSTPPQPATNPSSTNNEPRRFIRSFPEHIPDFATWLSNLGSEYI